MSKAVGILEVYGLTTAFVAADAACKAADVTLENFDKNKPANADKLPVPLLVTIKIRGDVAAVVLSRFVRFLTGRREGIRDAALEAGSLRRHPGDRIVAAGVVAEHVIPNPAEDTEKMLKLSGMDKR